MKVRIWMKSTFIHVQEVEMTRDACDALRDMTEIEQVSEILNRRLINTSYCDAVEAEYEAAVTACVAEGMTTERQQARADALERLPAAHDEWSG